MSGELTPLGGWLHQVERFVRRFVVISDDEATSIALWVAHSHAFAIAVATPYLSVSSAEMESGKTRLLEVLRVLVALAWFTGRTTAAALTRKIDKSSPTLLLDEGDPAFNSDHEYAETLRGVLNTGYRKGGAVTVCVGQGANLDVRDFSTFCPKAIAGLDGALPDTVESRSIPIRLKKRLPSERIERFRERTARAEGQAIASALEASVEPLMDELAQAEPELPDELSDRAQDVWEPLLAIADAAGGEWPERAREAAVRLSSQREPDEGTLGVRLLADAREVFNSHERLKTTELLEGLHAIEEAPWGDWYGKPLSAQKLAKLLRPFEIKPRQIWIDGENRRGFEREWFEDAWRRYLPHSGPVTARPARTASESRKTPDSDPLGAPPPSGFENPENPHGQADLAGLAATEGGYGGDGRPTEQAMRAMGLDPIPEQEA